MPPKKHRTTRAVRKIASQQEREEMKACEARIHQVRVQCVHAASRVSATSVLTDQSIPFPS